MKAIVYSQHGGPEVLKYTEAAKPQIDAFDVLVRVRACALNHLDLFLRGGLPGIKIPLPHIPGSDIAGEVAEVGEKVTGIKVGERVLLQPGISCGRARSAWREMTIIAASTCYSGRWWTAGARNM
jgi:NADPH:quinone reductase-like Zn-dependent oxidoreductase